MKPYNIHPSKEGLYWQIKIGNIPISTVEPPLYSHVNLVEKDGKWRLVQKKSRQSDSWIARINTKPYGHIFVDREYEVKFRNETLNYSDVLLVVPDKSVLMIQTKEERYCLYFNASAVVKGDYIQKDWRKL